MNTVWDRRNRRVSYQTPMEVLDIQKQKELKVSILNMSRGGMFVNTDANLEVGTQILCKIPFGQMQTEMEVHARVAWQRSAPLGGKRPSPMGVGIEFVDLSDYESQKIAEMVGLNLPDSSEAELEIQGVSGVVYGATTIEGGKAMFRSPLPYLSLGSEVQLNIEGMGEAQVGTIGHVDVQCVPGSKIPRLQVEIDLTKVVDTKLTQSPNRGSFMSDYEMLQNDRAITEKTLVESAADVPDSSNSRIEEEMQLLDTQKGIGIDSAEVQLDSAPLASSIPQMLPIVRADISGASVFGQEEAGNPFVEITTVSDMSKSVRISEEQAKWVWIGVCAIGLCIVGLLGFALALDDSSLQTKPIIEEQESIDKSNKVRALIEAPASAYLASDKEQEQDRAIARIRKEALGYGSEVEATGNKSIAKKDQVKVVESAALPKTPAPILKDIKETIKVKTKAKDDYRENIAGVRLIPKGDTLIIRLPLKGSMERARDYRLADPDGIAVNLPFAKPKAGYQKFLEPKNSKIKAIWVRERLGGLHFRVYFNKKNTSCKVEYKSSALELRCKS